MSAISVKDSLQKDKSLKFILLALAVFTVNAYARAIDARADPGIICPECFRAPSCDLECLDDEKCILEGPCECTATPTCVKIKPSPTVDPNCPLLWCKRLPTCDLVDCKEGYKCVIKGDCPCTAVPVCEPIEPSPTPSPTPKTSPIPSPSPSSPVVCPLCVKPCNLFCPQGQVCGYDGPCKCTAPLKCIPVKTTTKTIKTTPKPSPTGPAVFTVAINAGPIQGRAVDAVLCPLCIQECLLECPEGQICGFVGSCQCTAKQVCIPVKTLPPTTKIITTTTTTVTSPTPTTTKTKKTKLPSPTAPIYCPLCYRECALECAEGYHCEYNGPCICTAPQICVKNAEVTTTTKTKKIILPTIEVPPPID
ncbi:hypothetical protein HK098_005146 [Nowakowskiella sp. JEL0407]|nr:hypothetical protein HK098_005146 [Nowakowskiella sp. JEL0407]